MTPRHPRSPVMPGETVLPVGFRDELRSIRGLTPYIWPRDRPDLRLRVVLALLCLVVAKFVNITVPLLYKQAVDALSPAHQIIAVPVMPRFISWPTRKSGPKMWKRASGSMAKKRSCGTRTMV